MSWSGAIAALKANVTTAGTDVSPAIKTVRIGEPDQLNVDTIAMWPVGSRPSANVGAGRTLNLVFIDRGVLIRGYLRGSVRAGAIDETLEARLVALEEAIYTRLNADADCGGNADDLFIEGTEYGWEEIGNQLARTISLNVWLELPAIASLSR